MKKCGSVAIRGALTLLLVYGVYTETGVWTALSVLLIAVAVEIITATLLKLMGLLGL